MSVNRPLHVPRTSTAGDCEFLSTCDSDEHSAAATAVSYHACSSERVAFRRVSEAVASLTRAEVEAAARAPESTVAVLCYKQPNQAECVLQQCVGPRGTQSATSASQPRGVQRRILTPEGRGGWGRGARSQLHQPVNHEGCRGGSWDLRGEGWGK